MFVSFFMSLTNNRKCVEVGRGSEEVLHLACKGDEIRSPHLQLKGGTTSHVMTTCMPGTNIFFFFTYLFIYLSFFSLLSSLSSLSSSSHLSLQGGERVLEYHRDCYTRHSRTCFRSKRRYLVPHLTIHPIRKWTAPTGCVVNKSPSRLSQACAHQRTSIDQVNLSLSRSLFKNIPLSLTSYWEVLNHFQHRRMHQ